MQRQIGFTLCLIAVVCGWPQLSSAAPWLSVVNSPAEIHFIDEGGDAEIIALSNKVSDVQAVRISASDKPYIVALLKRKRKLVLDVYNYTGERLARRTVRTVTEPYRIGAARLEYVKTNNGTIMQVRFIRVDDRSDEPISFERKRYRIKPKHDDVITKTTTRRQDITDPTRPTTETADDIVEYMSAARLVAGMLPVKHSPSLDEGCALHAEYMRLNDDMTHYEDEAAPGYTEAGAAAGLESVLTYQYNDLMYSAIDLWLEAPYHRFSLLYPELMSIGWAVSDPLYYNEYYDKYFTCLNTTAEVAIAQSGYDKHITYWEHQNHEPIPYPGVNQHNVPIAFNGNESPDPLVAFGGSYPVGYGISLIFSDNDTITDVAATVTNEDGENVSGYLRGPNDPDDPNALYQGNAVLFMATEPFDYSTTYTVTITAQRNDTDYEKSWSFRTEAE